MVVVAKKLWNNFYKDSTYDIHFWWLRSLSLDQNTNQFLIKSCKKETLSLLNNEMKLGKILNYIYIYIYS